MKVSNTRNVTGLYMGSYTTTRSNGNKIQPIAVGGKVGGKVVMLFSLLPRMTGYKMPALRELRGMLEGRSIVAAAEWANVENFDAIGFAVRSADEAQDQIKEYSSTAKAVASYRQNVIDTLRENDRSMFQEKALAAFDARIAELFPAPVAAKPVEVIIRRTKLFFDGLKGEAPAGATYEFDALTNREFMKHFGHRGLYKLDEYVRHMVDSWNRRQPKNWKYEVITSPEVSK